MRGLGDVAADVKLSREVEGYDGLAQMARRCGLYPQFIEALRSAYQLGQEAVTEKFVDASFLRQPARLEQTDPSVAERECTRVKGISAIPDERRDGGEEA